MFILINFFGLTRSSVQVINIKSNDTYFWTAYISHSERSSVSNQISSGSSGFRLSILSRHKNAYKLASNFFWTGRILRILCMLVGRYGWLHSPDFSTYSMQKKASINSPLMICLRLISTFTWYFQNLLI